VKIIKIKLNPQKTKEEIKIIQQKVRENKGFCPCMLIKNESTKCICENFKTTRECICGLYVVE